MKVGQLAAKPLLKVSAVILGHAGTAPAAPDSGTIQVLLTVENTSHVPAQFPFLCVTDLGLNLQPCRHGRMEKISSDGRRLMRFGMDTAVTLRTGETLTIGTLTLSWRGGSTVLVSFDLGAGLPVAQLRDLRLFCVTGAANFPSERSHVTLPAPDIRKAAEAASRAAASGIWSTGRPVSVTH